MIPPHLREQPTQRPSVIRRGSRDLREKEVEVDQSHKIWKNEPSLTFRRIFQQKPSRRGLHGLRKFFSDPPTPQIPIPTE
ncbi:hypothetical protein O181_090223 [Austropuccinia psidii MF-1]|uniref:Uncharacterized protein n=1 Tax=Austropuccinia psidii MF-1 TaxID=1389203 RepID=A0A9Q3IUP0_9BASI|nr:hypothetical protein [Austropuccinia psidii MF-1]